MAPPNECSASYPSLSTKSQTRVLSPWAPNRDKKKHKIKGDSIKNLNNKQTFNGPILLKIHIIVVV